MYLFDTDTISNILKRKPSKVLIERLNSLNRKDQFISTITVAEIVYGAFKSSRTEYHMDNLRNSLIPSVNIVSFDENAAFVYGQIRADLEKAGKIINHTDLQIAAITMSNKYILITGNIRHFKRISNLRVENWI